EPLGGHPPGRERPGRDARGPRGPAQGQHQDARALAAARAALALGRAARAERAASFTQIEPELRKKIIERARRLASSRELTPHQVARHLAARTGRAVETIRLLLEKHDREQPDRAVFIDRTQPLTTQQKRVIARAHRMGVAIGKIAEHFKRTRATVYRVLRDMQAAALRKMEIRYADSPTFTRE